MPLPAVKVVFQDVNVRVKDTVILKNVSGESLQGELLAIMGPSGSGKTTLLNVLAGRGVGTLTGSILMNNVPLTKKLKRKIAFVLQEDIFFENLTLRETLVFTACLRLPSKMSYADKLEKVDDIVETLDLRKCLDTKIGSAMNRGLSGGEKKRTSIGSELLNDPAILVLDEPTTGLDSTTACNLIDMLQKYAVTHNKTVITSIHQPSSQIFYKFHKLMLLSEGEVVYLGSSHDIMDYFSSINLHCYIPHYNAADFILDKAKGTKEDLDILHKAANEQRWTTFNRRVPSIAGYVPQKSSSQMNRHAAMLADFNTVKENQDVVGVTSERFPDDSGAKNLDQDDQAAKEIITTEESAPTKESKDASVQEMNTNLNHQEATNTDKQEESPEHMKSEKKNRNKSEDDENDDIVLGERWASSWRTQYTTLCHRSFKQNLSEVLTMVDLLRHIVLGIIFGILYFQLDHTEERLHDIRGIVMDKAKGTKEDLDILHKAANEQRWTTFNRRVPSIAGYVPQKSSSQMNRHAAMLADFNTVKENQDVVGVTSERLPDDSGAKKLDQDDQAAKEIITTEESAPTKESKDASVQEMNTNLNHQEATNTDKQEESPEHMKSETKNRNKSEDDENDDIVLGERWASSWRTQYTTLCHRSFKQNLSEVLTMVDLLRHIVLGIIFGILYFQLDHTEERLHDIRGIIFFGTVYWGFDSVFTTITTFPKERDVINKERASGMYRLSAYYLAKLTSELPLMIIFPTIHFNIYYWLGGLNNFIGAYLAAWGILILNTLVGQSLGLAISAYSPDMSTSITFLAIYMLSAMMLGGFYVEILPFWLEWTQYLSFLFYTYNLFLRVEFNIRGDPVKCAKEESIFEECITGNATEVDGETALDSMDVLDIPVWANLVALGGFLLVFRLLGYYVLKIKYKPK
ncbi:uncharacterized protein [Amphiura filiformis]|uniref:uncharacterized protein n=1 Tax=Amphiura filiformis TaxID=82378 RepID=UPI003B217729